MIRMIRLIVDEEVFAETDHRGKAGVEAMVEEAMAGFDLPMYLLAALRDGGTIYIEPTNPGQEYTTMRLSGTIN